MPQEGPPRERSEQAPQTSSTHPCGQDQRPLSGSSIKSGAAGPSGTAQEQDQGGTGGGATAGGVRAPPTVLPAAAAPWGPSLTLRAQHRRRARQRPSRTNRKRLGAGHGRLPPEPLTGERAGGDAAKSRPGIEGRRKPLRPSPPDMVAACLSDDHGPGSRGGRPGAECRPIGGLAVMLRAQSDTPSLSRSHNRAESSGRVLGTDERPRSRRSEAVRPPGASRGHQWPQASVRRASGPLLSLPRRRRDRRSRRRPA